MKNERKDKVDGRKKRKKKIWWRKKNEGSRKEKEIEKNKENWEEKTSKKLKEKNYKMKGKCAWIIIEEKEGDEKDTRKRQKNEKDFFVIYSSNKKPGEKKPCGKFV